jgi:hypothetical protein
MSYDEIRVIARSANINQYQRKKELVQHLVWIAVYGPTAGGPKFAYYAPSRTTRSEQPTAIEEVATQPDGT